MRRLLVFTAVALCVASNGIAADQGTPATLDIYQPNTSSDLIANKEDPQEGAPIKVSVDAGANNLIVSIGVTGPKKKFSIH